MDSKNPLSSIFHDIEKYLENQEESLNQFILLKQDFLDGAQDLGEIYDSIYNLIKEDQNISAAFERSKSFFGKEPSSVDLIRDFTLFFTKNLSDTPDLIQLMAHVTSLFVENLISFDFLSYYTNLICPPNLFDQKLAELKKCLDENQQYIRQNSIPDIKIPDGTNILMSGKPSIGLEFLILISLLIQDEEQQKSILKCLRLYGLQFIPYEAALNWLISINEFIGHQFEHKVKVLNIQPSIFIPSNIFTELSASHSEIQMMWIFGATFYNFLKKMPKIESNSKSAIQLNNSRILEKNRKIDHHTSKAAPYIAELQSIKFFTTLKCAGQALRKGEPIITSIPEGVIDALFGHDCQLDKTDTFYRFLFEKCYEFGQKATQIQISLAKAKFLRLEPSSSDGRITFYELIRPAVILRSLVFSGAVFEVPNSKVLGLTFQVAEKTVSHFTKLSQKYEKLVNTLKTAGQFDVDDHAALSIVYFMILYQLIEKVDSSKIQLVQEIPNLIFEKKPPLQEFDMEAISNVDIVLKNFVQNLNKADESQFFNQTTPNFKKDFVFHIDVGKDVVISKGIMNSIMT